MMELLQTISPLVISFNDDNFSTLGTEDLAVLTLEKPKSILKSNNDNKTSRKLVRSTSSSLHKATKSINSPSSLSSAPVRRRLGSRSMSFHPRNRSNASSCTGVTDATTSLDDDTSSSLMSAHTLTSTSLHGLNDLPNGSRHKRMGGLMRLRSKIWLSSSSHGSIISCDSSVDSNEILPDRRGVTAKKSVSFSIPPESKTIVATATATAPTDQEINGYDSSVLYYNSKDFKRFSSQAVTAVKNATWKNSNKEKGTKLLQALLICAGYADDITAANLTEQEAWDFYYHGVNTEGVEDCPFSPRGLERQIVSAMTDARMQVIQNILAKQRDIQQHEQEKQQESKLSDEHKAAAAVVASQRLAVFARGQTTRTKRFARLLGKADAATLGNTTH